MPHNQAKVSRWNSLPVDSPMALLERRRVIGEKAMISHITLKAGFHVPVHQHENEQFTVVLAGQLRFDTGAEGGGKRTVDVAAGEVIHLPANLPHAATALEDSVVLDIFSPPSPGTGIDRH